MREFTLKKPFDMHVHFRDGEMLRLVAQYTACHFYRALVMPNLRPPITTSEHVDAYMRRILGATAGYPDFTPLMTFKILPETTASDIAKLAEAQLVVAGKVYPKGLTTHADDGVEDFLALFDVFAAMQKHGLVLCLHGEMPGSNILGRDREREFLRILKFIARTFPGLKIVMEHITTAAAVEVVLTLPENVAATITVHHLLLTQDDVGVDRMCPAHYCKPVAKDPADRQALIEAATSGCGKFFFGSDSAPHPREGKERQYDCCAGIFTAPVALQLLAEIFERQNALGSRFERFIRQSAGVFYGIEEPFDYPAPTLRFTKDPWVMPETIGNVVPFYAGKTLAWKVAEVPS